MAIKMEFEQDDCLFPKRLMCYGSLPLKNTTMLKVFEGHDCHFKFLLWAFQNVTDYKVDARQDQTNLNIFTLGGSYNELPLLLRAMV